MLPLQELILRLSGQNLLFFPQCSHLVVRAPFSSKSAVRDVWISTCHEFEACCGQNSRVVFSEEKWRDGPNFLRVSNCSPTDPQGFLGYKKMLILILIC